MLSVLIKSSSRYPIRRKAIKQTIQQTLESLQLFGNFEVEVEIIGDRMMKQMKKKHLGIDETTDVLSFPLEEVFSQAKSAKPCLPAGRRKVQSGEEQAVAISDQRLEGEKKAPMINPSIDSGRSDQLSDNSEIRNTKYEIPFKYPDHITRLGTILISYPQAQRQANLHKLTTDKEINQLIEHGMLHLVGIHHE